MWDLKAGEPRTASAAEVLHLASSVIFLLYSCLDKIARGGLWPFYGWVTEHVDSATLCRTKDRHLALSPSLLGGWSSFYVHSPYSNRGCTTSVGWSGHQWRSSDAEWSPPPHLPLTFDKGLGGCIFVDGINKGCALETPEHICNALAPRQTQIIPLEL